MTDDEPRPSLADLSELERHALGEVVQDGRVVDDPRLAAAAVELARQQQRAYGWLAAGALALAVVTGIVVAVVAGDGFDWRPVALTVGLVLVLVAGTVLYGLGDIRAALRRNQALLDGQPLPDDGLTVGQHLGNAVLGLFIAFFAARIVGFAITGLLRIFGIRLDEVSTTVQTVLGVALTLLLWVLCYRSLVSRQQRR